MVSPPRTRCPPLLGSAGDATSMMRNESPPQSPQDSALPTSSPLVLPLDFPTPGYFGRPRDFYYVPTSSSVPSQVNSPPWPTGKWPRQAQQNVAP